MKKPQKYRPVGLGTTELERSVDDYIDYLASGDYNSDKAENYTNDIFEKAVQLFYGPDVWGWVNERIEESDE